MQQSNVLDISSTSSNQQMVDLVTEEMESSKLSQAQAAKEIGISETALSQWRRQKYSGDNSAVEIKIENWLSTKAKRRQSDQMLPDAPDYYETYSGKRITSTLTYAHMAADLVVIYGGAGVGKTKSTRRYAKANPNVWIIEGTPTCNTMGGFLRHLAAALGVRLPKGHHDVLEANLRERLKDCGGLIIVDEAQFLNERALEIARRLAEMTNNGLALVGNETVYAQLTGRNRAAEFAQLFSRIGKKVRLTRPTPTDIEAACKAWDITNRAERDLLADIAAKPGALRMMTKTLRLAGLMAKGGKITIEHLKAAWKDLGGE
ncbi:MAG: AAA family ATPase [Gammaproteobacteria bacterium]|nr:AAA family ATPase [Gammaproteobacteria bacterium]